ncbi:MAG: hypothetical protein AAF611_19710 [Bacteroidota bacterium]
MNTLKSIRYFSIAAFSLLFLTYASCNDDDIQEEVQDQQAKFLDFTGVIVAADSIFDTNIELRQHIQKTFSSKTPTGQKATISTDLGFSIDTTAVQLLRNNTFESYTFAVQRDTEHENSLENYVITYYSDQRYTQFLIRYPYTKTVDGKKPFDVSNCTITNINSSAIISKSIGCQSYAQEWVAGECFDVNCNAAGTGNGMHSPGQHCNAEPGDQPYTYCEPGTWVNTFCVQYLSDNEGISGSGSGSTTGGNSNTNNDTQGTAVSFPTVPFEISNQSHQKNCDELAINSNSEAFSNRMQELKTATNGTIEKGFGIYNGSYANPADANPLVGALLDGTAQGGPDIPYHPFQKGIAHNHLNNPVYNHIGTFTTKDMFMLNNIVTLNQLQGNYVQDHEMAAYLVCQEGNYAIKVADQTKFYNFTVKYATDQDFKNKINEFYKDENIIHGKPKNEQNLGFLKLLKNHDVGLRLYESDENFQNWKELTIGRNDTILENPC